MTWLCGSTTASVPLGASHFSSCDDALLAPLGPALPVAIEPPLPSSCAKADEAMSAAPTTTADESLMSMGTSSYCSSDMSGEDCGRAAAARPSLVVSPGRLAAAPEGLQCETGKPGSRIER